MKQKLIVLFLVSGLHTLLAQPMPANSAEGHKVVIDSLAMPSEMEGPSIRMAVEYKFVQLFNQTFGSDTIVNSLPGKKLSKYPSGSTITLSTDNEGAGLSAIYLRLNDMPEKQYTAPFRLQGRGKYSLVIRATDTQGRETLSPPVHFEVVNP